MVCGTTLERKRHIYTSFARLIPGGLSTMVKGRSVSHPVERRTRRPEGFCPL